MNNFLSNILDKVAQKRMLDFQNGDTLPTVTVTADFAGIGKDDKKACDVVFMSPDTNLYGQSFTLTGKNSTVQYQGTSSMAYPIKNYKLKLKDENGKKFKFKIIGDGQPESTFTLKADFMSSGHWQNTGLARWISDHLYHYDTKDEKSMNPMKWYSIQNDGSLSDTRETINGFPCRLILINDGTGTLNEGQAEPTSGNTKDMGIFNFNLDKGCTDSFGLDNETFPRCISYEVAANSDTSAGAFVPFYGDKIDYYIKDNTKYSMLVPIEIVGNSIVLAWYKRVGFYNQNKELITEMRVSTTPVEVPQDAKYFSIYGLEEMEINGKKYYFGNQKESLDLAEMQSSNPNAEIEYLQSSFELRYPDEEDVGSDYGYLGMTVDGTFSSDYGLKRVIDFVGKSTDEEFVANFEQYFNKQYTFRYYLLVMTLAMVDNLGKNMMLDTWDGKIWHPRFYDLDTICSYDNAGAIKFDVDVEMEQGYWNTSQSRLWTRIRDLFHSELVEIYKDMRNNGLDYNTLMSYFYDKQIAMIPQSYYNKDSDVKYIPYADQYLGKAHGDGYEHLKRWLKNRIIFVDTLFDFESSYNNDVLTIRANTTEQMTITIETYTPLYQHITWKNGDTVKLKVDGKNPTTFTGKVDALTDQEILIYGGYNIKRITGISSMNPDQMLIGAATRLVELVVTDSPLLTDINSNKANLSAHTYLNKLDLSGCTALGGTLRLNNSPLIREVNIKGTAITTVQLPSSIRNLTTLRLPKGVTSLELNDARLLSTLELEEGHNLNNISLTNCNKLTNCINFDLTQVETVRLDNSYDTEELYMSKTTNLTLNNMKNLKRLIYIPNEEVEEFNLSNLMSASEYAITTFNCPNLTDFITTAQQRRSYGLESDGNIYLNKVFMASLLDLSNTQFTNIKFLCTTDLYKLMLPTTVKNFYCDSAFDLDTSIVTDGDYDVIHGDLIEPYTTNYESNVYHGSEEVSEKIIWNAGNISNIYPSLNHGDHYSQQINVIPNTDFSLEIGVNWCRIYGFDDSDTKVWEYGGNSTTDATASSGTFPSNVTHIRIAGIGGASASNNLTYQKPYTPNIVPTSANGSLIYNVWSQLGTQPTSTSPYIWDLTGLKFNDFHTYGMNNWVKTDDSGNITMPQRTTGYSVRLQNVDITPNQYNTMLYPKLVDTTLPITGKLDYSKYKGNNLSWAFAYTTDDVVRTPMDSRDMANIKYDYNKLYGTDFVDIVDVWIYKDSDCSNLSTNENITKAYIELTSDNYTTRIDEVLQWYPNCTDLYFFDDGSVTTLYPLFGTYGSSENCQYKSQIKTITFLENYFPNLRIASSLARGLTSLESIYNLPNTITQADYLVTDSNNFNYLSNLPNSITILRNAFASTSIVSIPNIPTNIKDLAGAFKNCKNFNQQLDLSSYNINNNNLDSVFNGCSSLTYTPILPSNYKGRLDNAFSNTKITTAPVLPNGVTSLNSTFRGCTELTTVGNIPTSCTNFERFINDCPKITSVPQEGWKGNLSGTFWNAPLLNQQINIESATSLDNTFNACSSLSIAPQLPQNANCSMSACFRGTSLITPPITPQGVTSMANCYQYCGNLETPPIISEECTNISYIVSGCKKLTNITIPLKNILSYRVENALQNCTALVDIDWIGKRTTDFNLTGLSCPSYTQEDLKELVNENLDDLYKDKIKISFSDSKVTINGTETTI